MTRRSRLTPIRKLMLSVRTTNCLELAEINTVEELVGTSDAELLRIPNFGMKSLKEVRRLLTNTDKLQLVINGLVQEYGCRAVLTAITRVPSDTAGS